MNIEIRNVLLLQHLRPENFAGFEIVADGIECLRILSTQDDSLRSFVSVRNVQPEFSRLIWNQTPVHEHLATLIDQPRLWIRELRRIRNSDNIADRLVFKVYGKTPDVIMRNGCVELPWVARDLIVPTAMIARRQSLPPRKHCDASPNESRRNQQMAY